MKTTRTKKTLSLILCIMLIAAIALFATGCNDSNTHTTTTTPNTAQASEVTELGTGQKSFDFTVVDAESKETKFKIRTDKKFVGEALQELGLIKGEAGPYGLYVKTVNSITLDYDKDGKYWAFYVNGEYGQTGVDLTEIVDGTVYTFKAE